MAAHSVDDALAEHNRLNALLIQALKDQESLVVQILSLKIKLSQADHEVMHSREDALKAQENTSAAMHTIDAMRKSNPSMKWEKANTIGLAPHILQMKNMILPLYTTPVEYVTIAWNVDGDLDRDLEFIRLPNVEESYAVRGTSYRGVVVCLWRGDLTR